MRGLYRAPGYGLICRAPIENLPMTRLDEDLTKRRDIDFGEPHPDPRQAHSAAELLRVVDGVLETEALSVMVLRIHYDIRCITLAEIEDELAGRFGVSGLDEKASRSSHDAS